MRLDLIPGIRAEVGVLESVYPHEKVTAGLKDPEDLLSYLICIFFGEIVEGEICYDQIRERVVKREGLCHVKTFGSPSAGRQIIKCISEVVYGNLGIVSGYHVHTPSQQDLGIVSASASEIDHLLRIN